LYHIMMYTRFVNDLNFDAFIVPSFVRGFALAVLYIAIGIYATTKLLVPQILKVVGLILIVRSFLGPGIISGLYNYFLYADTNKHLSTLASQIDANEPMAPQRADFAGYYQYMVKQANLAALKEISGSIIFFGLSIIAVLIVLLVYRDLKRRISAMP